MSNTLFMESSVCTDSLAGWEALNSVYREHPLSDADRAIFGRVVVENTILLETPAAVLARGHVLTNPSQLEVSNAARGGGVTARRFAYFRDEPTSLHLGNTLSVPYIVDRTAKGEMRLTEFGEAMTVEGEDPRLTWGVRMLSGTGRVHQGWLQSSVVATPMPGNPADVQGIRQVFRWGKSLDTLEVVHEIPNLKNTCVYPVAGGDDDTSVHVFGRPTPDITYARARSITDITPDVVNNGLNLTRQFLPHNQRVHTGVNTVNSVADHPGFFRLNAHEAYTPIVKGADNKEHKTLHYRLVDYGYELPNRQYPKGRVILLGVIATRRMFPAAEPKPPENGVADYFDILYGSAGQIAPQVNGVSQMITGISDRHVGMAILRRVA